MSASVSTNVHFDDGLVDIMGHAHNAERVTVCSNVRTADTSNRPYVALVVGPITFFIYNPDTLHAIALEAVGAKGELASQLQYEANRQRDEALAEAGS